MCAQKQLTNKTLILSTKNWPKLKWLFTLISHPSTLQLSRGEKLHFQLLCVLEKYKTYIEYSKEALAQYKVTFI